MHPWSSNAQTWKSLRQLVCKYKPSNKIVRRKNMYISGGAVPFVAEWITLRNGVAKVLIFKKCKKPSEMAFSDGFFFILWGNFPKNVQLLFEI